MNTAAPGLEALLEGPLFYCDASLLIHHCNTDAKSMFPELASSNGALLTDLFTSINTQLSHFAQLAYQHQILVIDKANPDKTYKLLKTRSTDAGQFYIFARYLSIDTERQQTAIVKALRLVGDYSSKSIATVNSAGQFSYANQMFFETFGIENREASTVELKQLVKEQVTYALLAFQLANNQQAPIRLDQAVEFVGQQGQQLWMSVQLHPILHSDMTVVVLANISEQVQISKDLAAAKSLLKEAETERTRLLANISHELRTPLTSIRGMLSNIALTDSPSLSSDELDLMLHATDSLNFIIDEMLMFAQGNLSSVKLAPKVVDLSEFTQQVYAIANSQHHRAQDDITFELQVQSTLPTFVYLDTFRTQQIIFNLITNAFKFTSSGKITLAFDSQLSEHDADECLLTISVSDSGVGIAKDKLTSIFTAFKQLDNQTTRSTFGVGLGLSIVEKLVHLMNGTLGVQSELGLGSVFSVSLPLKIADKIEVNSNNEQSLSLNGLRILLAEDNHVNAAIIKRNLLAQGCNVDIAVNGERAVDACTQSKYDLILMDVQMPIMDGYAASKQILNTHNIPIIGLTADSTTLSHSQCLAAGMLAVVAKPVVFETLHRTIIKYSAPAQAESEHTNSGALDNVEEYVADLSDDAHKFVTFFKLDKQQIERYQTHIDIDLAMSYAEQDCEFYQECVQIFDESLQTINNQLADLSDGAYILTDIGFMAHQLASSAGMIGASTLSKQAKAVSVEIEQSSNCDMDMLVALKHECLRVSELVTMIKPS